MSLDPFPTALKRPMHALSRLALLTDRMTDATPQSRTPSRGLRTSQRPTPIELALAWARDHVGVCEDAPGRGPEIDEWQRACGLVGYPWCGAFVGAALRSAGVEVPAQVAWTPSILEWAREGSHGFSLHPWAEREVGDLVLFAFDPDGDEVQHVGLLDTDRRHTIEGNTSTGTGGSQDRGGVVARRDRDGVGVVGCARPPWH